MVGTRPPPVSKKVYLQSFFMKIFTKKSVFTIFFYEQCNILPRTFLYFSNTEAKMEKGREGERKIELNPF